MTNIERRDVYLNGFDRIERNWLSIATGQVFIAQTKVVVEVRAVDGDVVETTVATVETATATGLRGQAGEVVDRTRDGRQGVQCTAVDVHVATGFGGITRSTHNHTSNFFSGEVGVEFEVFTQCQEYIGKYDVLLTGRRDGHGVRTARSQVRDVVHTPCTGTSGVNGVSGCEDRFDVGVLNTGISVGNNTAQVGSGYLCQSTSCEEDSTDGCGD